MLILVWDKNIYFHHLFWWFSRPFLLVSMVQLKRPSFGMPPWFEPGVFAPKKSLLEVPCFFKRQWGEVKVAEVRWCGQISLTKTTDIGKTHFSLYLLHVTWHGFILYTITWVFFVETYLPFVFQNLHKHQIIVISHQVSSLEPPFYTPKLTSEVVGGVGSLRKTCWYTLED